jgi:hypothetical protein
MTNYLMNSRLRLTVFAVAIALVPAMLSVAAGAKDKTLSKTELKHLIATAETKAEHERIAQHFAAEATKYEAEAKEHGDLAVVYQKNTPSQPGKYPGSMQTFNHCDSLTKSLQQAAENARKLAADHREMAAKEAK